VPQEPILVALQRVLPEDVAQRLWKRALQHAGYTDGHEAQLPHVISCLKVIIALYLDAKQQAAVLAGLQVIETHLPSPRRDPTSRVTAKVANDRGVREIRDRAIELIAAASDRAVVGQRVSNIISNLGYMLVDHGGGGTLEITVRSSERQVVILSRSDRQIDRNRPEIARLLEHSKGSAGRLDVSDEGGQTVTRIQLDL
jgi:hypothetical protein